MYLDTMMKNIFIKDLAEVPWETIEAFDKVDDIEKNLGCLFLHVMSKHI